MTDLRRRDDDRYRLLEKKVDGVAETVSDIRDMLISEPEASPLGRALLKRIVNLEEEVEPIAEWWQQWRGVWRFILGLGVVLGIVATVFGVAAYFGQTAH